MRYTDAETTLNAKLADLLGATRYNWVARTEVTDMMKGAQIDVLIVEQGYPHVMIECKIGLKPEDTTKRFKNKFRDRTTPKILFEVKYEENMNSDRLAESTLRYCVHLNKNRFPTEGLLEGGVQDLSTTIQFARINAMDYRKGVDILNQTINTIAGIIGARQSRILDKISNIMQQEHSEQTWAMAALTMAGAVSFHDLVAEHNNLPLLNEMTSDGVSISSILDVWKAILDINYYPIFAPAREILQVLPQDEAIHIIQLLKQTNENLISKELVHSPDLYGQIFQRVINDRKKLASFYTKPESAALLVAATTPNEYPWNDIDFVKKFRVADFACGTGTLLQSAYRMLTAKYEAASGKSMRELHPTMMSECIVGADVLPIAVHLTAASLTSMYPTKDYEHTRIYHVTQGGSEHKIGSLEWIKDKTTLFPSEYRLTGKDVSGETTAPSHNTCHMAIINPPYVRSQGPGGRTDSNDPRQIFTAFNATISEQYKMSKRASELFRDLKPSKIKTHNAKTFCANKKAGLATFFMDLAHYKLRRGGRLGLVLPMTAATGVLYKKLRKLISEQYTDVIVFSVGDNASESFSADTGMKEIIMTARKLRDGESPSKRGLFVSLDDAPNSTLEGFCIGSIASKTQSLRLEDKPHGGTRIKVGEQEVGTVLDCPTSDTWDAVGVSDFVLQQTVYWIKQGRIILPNSKPLDATMTTLGKIAEIGPSDLQILGSEAQPGRMTSYSGPFNLRNYRPRSVYHALWNNNRGSQRQMTVQPDKTLERRANATDEDIDKVWKTRAHLHVNLTTRVTSQSLMVAYVEKPTIGGRAFPSILIDEKFEKSLAVWCNSTLGILCRWGMSNRQQEGRTSSSRTAILDLPVLDVTKLTKKQIWQLDCLFDEFAGKPLGRMKNLWKSEARKAMDDRMLKILQYNVNLDDIRWLLCNEPSIHDGNTIELHMDSNEQVKYKARQTTSDNDFVVAVYATSRRIILRWLADKVERQVVDYTYDMINDIRLDTTQSGPSRLTLSIPAMTETLDGFQDNLDSIVIDNLPKVDTQKKPATICRLYEYVCQQIGKPLSTQTEF